jgi:hypothetical protein
MAAPPDVAKRLDFHDVSLQLPPPAAGPGEGPEEVLASLGEPSIEGYRRCVWCGQKRRD